MRYYLLDAQRRRIGPYEMAELTELYRRGTIGFETLVVAEDGFEPVLFREIWDRAKEASEGSRPPPLPPEREKEGAFEEGSIAGQAGADLKALIPHLLMPFESMRDWSWLQNRRLLVVAGVGLLPLLLIGLFAGRGEVRGAYWAIALYFSALWGVFFYYVFPAPGIRLNLSAACFFGTGFFSISMLFLAYRIPPLSWVPALIHSNHLFITAFGFIVGVGVPEEFCKALTLWILARYHPQLAPQTMVFYGLMSGLGFGIYEGVGYQLGRNLAVSSGAGEYYLLNLIRLTTLPFLHALWSGTAGYFIGFALQYPRRRYGLWMVAIGLPAMLHGLYNTFSGSILGFGIGLGTVLVLNLYLAKTIEFERALRQDRL